MKAGLLMALESSGARAEQLARQMLHLWPADPARGDRRQDRRGDGRERARRRPRADRARPAGGRGARARRGLESAAAIAETVWPPQGGLTADWTSASHGVLPHRQLCRAVPAIDGERRLAARAADGRTSPNGRRCARRAAISSRPGSRPGRPTISPAAPSAAGSSATPRTSAPTWPTRSSFPQAGQRAGRRADARQYPARRRAGRQPRLLDGRAVMRARAIMTAAVRALVPFAFGTLRLHRLEAACIPTNAASIRLLEKTGFQREGYARAISLHQRHVAGPSALCPAQGRPAACPRPAAPASGFPGALGFLRHLARLSTATVMLLC